MDPVQTCSYGIVRPFLSLAGKYQYSSVLHSDFSPYFSDDEVLRMVLFSLRGVESSLFRDDCNFCNFEGVNLAGYSKESSAQILVHFRNTFMLRKTVGVLCEAFRDDSLDFSFKTLATTLEQLLVMYDSSCVFLQSRVLEQVERHSVVTVLHDSSLFRSFLIEVVCCFLPQPELDQLRELMSCRLNSSGCAVDARPTAGSTVSVSPPATAAPGDSGSPSGNDDSFVSTTTDRPDDPDFAADHPDSDCAVETEAAAAYAALYSKLLSPAWFASVFNSLSSWELFDRLYRQMIRCPQAIRDSGRVALEKDAAPFIKAVIAGVFLKSLSKPLLSGVVDILFEENAYRSLGRRLKTEAILGASQSPEISITYSPTPAKSRNGALGGRSVRAQVEAAAPLMLAPANSLAQDSSSPAALALFSQYCPLLLVSMVSLLRVFNCETGPGAARVCGGAAGTGALDSQFAAQVTSCLLWANARIIVCNATRNKHALSAASRSVTASGVDEEDFGEVMDLSPFAALMTDSFPFTYAELAEWMKFHRHIEKYSARAEKKLVFLLNEWKATRHAGAEGLVHSTPVKEEKAISSGKGGNKARAGLSGVSSAEDDQLFVLKVSTDMVEKASGASADEAVSEPELSSSSVFVSELVTPPKALECATIHALTSDVGKVEAEIGSDRPQEQEPAAGLAVKMEEVGGMRSILRGQERGVDVVDAGGAKVKAKAKAKGQVRMADAVEFSDGTASKPTSGAVVELMSPLGMSTVVPRHLFDQAKSTLLRKYEEKGRMAERQLRATKWRQRALLSKQQRSLTLLRHYTADIKGWKRELKEGRREVAKETARPTRGSDERRLRNLAEVPTDAAEPTAHELITGGATVMNIATKTEVEGLEPNTMVANEEEGAGVVYEDEVGCVVDQNSSPVQESAAEEANGDDFADRMVAVSAESSVSLGAETGAAAPEGTVSKATKAARSSGTERRARRDDRERIVSEGGFLDPEMETLASLLTQPLNVESMEEQDRVNDLLSSLNDSLLLLGAECGLICEEEEGGYGAEDWGDGDSNVAGVYANLMALSALRVKNCVVDVVSAQCCYVDRLSTINLLNNTAFFRITDVLQETALLSPFSDFLQVFAQLMVSNTHAERRHKQSIRRMAQAHFSAGPALRFEADAGTSAGADLPLAGEYEDQVSQLLWHNIRISDVFKSAVQLAHMRCSNICSDLDESGGVNMSSSYLMSLYIPWRGTGAASVTVPGNDHGTGTDAAAARASSPISQPSSYSYDINGPLPTVFDSLGSLQVILPPLPFPLNTVYDDSVLHNFSRVSIRLLKMYQLLAVSKLLWEDCREMSVSMGSRMLSGRRRRKRGEAAAGAASNPASSVDAAQRQQQLVDLLYSGLRGSIATLQCLLDFTADRVKSTQYHFHENMMLAGDHGIAACTMAVQQYAADLLLSCFVCESPGGVPEPVLGARRGLRDVEFAMGGLMEQLIDSYRQLLEHIYIFFFYYRFPVANAAGVTGEESSSVHAVATPEVQTNVGNAVMEAINRCNAAEKELCDNAHYGMLIRQSDSMFALVTILSSKI